MVTMNLTVEGSIMNIPSHFDVLELNTIYEGRCYKIDSKKSFPGDARVFSMMRFQTDRKDAVAYSIFFAYDVNVPGIVVDYMSVPYEETFINNRELNFLRIG